MTLIDFISLDNYSLQGVLQLSCSVLWHNFNALICMHKSYIIKNGVWRDGAGPCMGWCMGYWIVGVWWWCIGAVMWGDVITYLEISFGGYYYYLGWKLTFGGRTLAHDVTSHHNTHTPPQCSDPCTAQLAHHTRPQFNLSWRSLGLHHTAAKAIIIIPKF